MTTQEVKELVNDILTAKRNVWFHKAGLHIYIRPAREGYWPLQIPNISADVPGKGVLTALLNELEPLTTLMFENVVNDRLVDYLLRRGYKIVNQEWNYGSPHLEKDRS